RSISAPRSWRAGSSTGWGGPRCGLRSPVPRSCGSPRPVRRWRWPWPARSGSRRRPDLFGVGAEVDVEQLVVVEAVEAEIGVELGVEVRLGVGVVLLGQAEHPAGQHARLREAG